MTLYHTEPWPVPYYTRIYSGQVTPSLDYNVCLRLKRLILDYTRVHYGLGQFLPRVYYGLYELYYAMIYPLWSPVTVLETKGFYTVNRRQINVANIVKHAVYTRPPSKIWGLWLRSNPDHWRLWLKRTCSRLNLICMCLFSLRAYPARNPFLAANLTRIEKAYPVSDLTQYILEYE